MIKNKLIIMILIIKKNKVKNLKLKKVNYYNNNKIQMIKVKNK